MAPIAKRNLCALCAALLIALPLASCESSRYPVPKREEVESSERQFTVPSDGDLIAIFTTSLGEVRQPRFPSVLLEIGYHDNYADATWLEGHWDAIAQQIARGLTEYFGLPFIYPMDPVEGTVRVTSGTLNLRDAPSSSGQVIANLPNGAKVTVYGEWNGWYVVHYGDQVGYAAAAYIDV